MSNDLKEAMRALEKEKNISSDVLFEAIENALMSACRNQFGRTDNITVEIDRENFGYQVYATKEVVETEDDVMDPLLEIALDKAQKIDPDAQVGHLVKDPIDSKTLGRISTANAKNVITQKIREEERSAVYNYYYALQKDIVTGIIQRRIGNNFSVNLGRADGLLPENEQVPSEHLRPTDRVKVYIVEVRSTQKDSKVPGVPRILVSRTHPELVKRLFEQEVAEIRDGTVEIMSIAREAGSRTKIAVWSNNPNVDPVGACVGVNGTRVNNIVDELRGEKIDIVNWDENPGNFIQNALSPARIVAVYADPDARTAKVVVPDYQLSLAIGREGQNERLAAKLTNYKIDIKSETQAKDTPGFRMEDYMDSEGYEETDGYYDENGEFIPLSEGQVYYDENGNPIEYVDENGNPIEYVDENGNPIEYVDEDGNPIEYVDENGNPIEYVDEDGNPIEYVDEDGNPVNIDGTDAE